MRKALLIFCVLIVVTTFPLVFRLNTSIPGFFSTDEPYGHLWNSWRIRYSCARGLPLNRSDFIAHPYGINFLVGGFISLWSTLDFLLSLLAGPALTYNLQVIINFLLNAVVTYLLVYYLTASAAGAIFSAIAFAFCPYAFIRSWQHLGLTYLEWIPLSLMAAILLRANATRRRAALFLISLFLLFSFDYTITYLGLVTLAVFIFYIFIYDLKMKSRWGWGLFAADLKYLKKVLVLAGACFMLLSLQILPFIIGTLKFSNTAVAGAHNSYRRPFEDLFVQSARPLSYLLPSSVHPLFGRFTEQFIGSALYGISFTEHTLYLGWVVLLLAFLAFKRWRKRKLPPAETVPSGNRTDNSGAQEAARENFYIGFFLFLALAGWLFSQPPWWSLGPLKIYMPSFFMYKILPMYRAYCRFGILVMLAVAVLAGFGLKFILERFRPPKIKTAITTLFCGLVLFEFWNWPPHKIIDVSRVPAAYSWLKGQPSDLVIAEYPLDIGGPNEMYKFYQTVHEKKIINGTIPGTPAHTVAKSIVRLSLPQTAAGLKWMGVSYVLVHRDDYLDSGLIEDREELLKISKSKNLRLIKSFLPQGCPGKDICTQKSGSIDIYEITALPKEPSVEH